VLVVQQTRLAQHRREELLRHFAGQQPVAILAEAGRVPHPLVHAKPYEPAEQQVVLHLLHQHPLAPHRVQHLQQQRPQQLRRRDRRPPCAGVHGFEHRLQLYQGLVRYLTQTPQRMILWHTPAQTPIAEQLFLYPLVSTHTSSY
jgi:hypothetical protein